MTVVFCAVEVDLLEQEFQYHDSGTFDCQCLVVCQLWRHCGVLYFCLTVLIFNRWRDATRNEDIKFKEV